MKGFQKKGMLMCWAVALTILLIKSIESAPERKLFGDMMGGMMNAGIKTISGMGFNPYVNDPSLVEEQAATNMENFDENDPASQVMTENEINPNEEEEIDQAMGNDDHQADLDPAVAEYFGDHEHGEEGDHEGHEEEEHEHEGEPEHGEIGEDQIIDHGLVALEHHNDLEKMQNFKKISDDCKIFLEDFRDCLDNIPDAAWDEEEIQKCIGKDFTRVVNNICKS
jgi:hypothetical protein